MNKNGENNIFIGIEIFLRLINELKRKEISPLDDIWQWSSIHYTLHSHTPSKILISRTQFIKPNVQYCTPLKKGAKVPKISATLNVWF